MKKVLFLIPTLTGGGAEKVLVNLVNNMDEYKYSLTVMTLFNVGINKQYIKDHIEYKYIFNRLFRGNIHLFKLFSPKKLFNLMIKDDYDIIISYLQGPTTRIVAGCPNPKTKIVNWVHLEMHDIKNLSRSYRNEKEVKDCYSRFDSTVFVSETAKVAFQNIMPEINENLKVIYNTVETDEIKKRSLEEIVDVQFDKNKINLISVGRFTHQKGYERLLYILNRLVKEDNLNVHLYLLGQGELEAKYRKIISEKNISDYVTFLGYKDNPYKYVKNSDLFVCSSYYEGFSTAVTEALIVGAPVITTLCSGMEEMLGENGEYGIVVENNDESLYFGLRDLLKDKNELERIKIKSQERSNFFDKSNTVKAVEKHLEELVEY